MFDVLQKWKALVENETGLKLKCLKSNNGGEYIDGTLEKYCAENRIRHMTAILGKPQQNSMAELMNRTISECARSMWINVGLQKQFWTDVVSTTAYLINRGPSVSLNCGIPEKAQTGKEVNLSHLKIFDYISYVHIDSDKTSKLDPKSRKCVVIGYGSNNYGYRYMENQKLI